jgi:hypothetical protein
MRLRRCMHAPFLPPLAPRPAHVEPMHPPRRRWGGAWEGAAPPPQPRSTPGRAESRRLPPLPHECLASMASIVHTHPLRPAPTPSSAPLSRRDPRHPPPAAALACPRSDLLTPAPRRFRPAAPPEPLERVPLPVRPAASPASGRPRAPPWASAPADLTPQDRYFFPDNPHHDLLETGTRRQ